MGDHPLTGPRGHIILWVGIAAAIGVGALLFLPGHATAQCASGPAPNDCFSAAVVVAATPYTGAQSTVGSGMESGEPAPCGAMGATIWYSWTPSTSGVMTVDTATSNFDTVAAAYTGSAVNALTNLACNDDFASTPQSSITFSCTAGTTYRIQIGGFGGATGLAQVHISNCAPPPACVNGPPANDCFASSRSVASAPYSNTQSTTGAGTESGEPAPCGGMAATIWYDWTPTTSGYMTVDTATSSYDTVAAAYTGATLNSLTNLACNDDFASTPQSSITFSCTAGTKYWIQIGGYNGVTGLAQVHISDCLPPPPCSSGPPPNDCFVSPIVIPSAPYLSPVQSTVGATTEFGEPATVYNVGKTVWYQWTPAFSGTATMDTCASSYDTVLAVYTGSNVGALTQVVVNDQACGNQSRVTFTCTAGTVYQVQVGSWSNTVGGNLQLAVTGCMAAPTCAPATQTIAPGPASFSVTGQPTFTWSAPGSSNPTGSGATFTTSYATGGTYSVTVTNSAGSSSCTVNVVVPGCGYTVTSVPVDFVDLTGTGAGLPHGDDTVFDVAIPFTFNYCGLGYNSIRTSSNGYVCLGTSPGFSCTDWSPVALPSTVDPRPAIFGYYSDLYASFCSSSTPASCTSTQVTGTAPNRVFTYMEKAVGYCCSSSPNPVSFEIKLFEGSNCFQVHYLSVSDSGGHRVIGGYQDDTGTTSFTYADSRPGFVRANTAWGACPFGASGDSYTFIEDQPGADFNVLANDNGAGSPLTIQSNTSPAKGTLTPQVGGVFTYTPAQDAVGADSFTYTVRDSVGRTSTATVDLLINPVNDAPRFVAPTMPIVDTPTHGPYAAPWATGVQPGPPTAVDETGQAITFTLVSNTNPALFATPPTVSRTGSATSTSPITPPVSGAYAMLQFEPAGESGQATVCFVARDNGGTATVTSVGVVPAATAQGVDVSAQHCVDIIENGPPVAYFEVDSSQAAPGQALSFNACPRAAPACSYDLDGFIAQYVWDFGDGTIGSGMAPNHAYGGPGNYLVRLTVWDNAGLTSVMVRTIHVQLPGQAPVQSEGDIGSVPPIADAGANFTALASARVQIVGTAHGANEQARFQWSQVAGPEVVVSNATTPTVAFVAPTLKDGNPVAVMLKLRVTQGALVSAPDYVTITIVSANRPPEANAGGTITVTEQTPVTLDGSHSTDPDGTDLVYRWERVAGPAVVMTGADSAVASFIAPQGTALLQFRLTVSDGTSTSVDVDTVYVQPAEASPEGVRMGYEVRQSPGGGVDVRFTALGATDAAWEFGDGSAPAMGSTVAHHYPVGSYDATMTVGGKVFTHQFNVATPGTAPVVSKGSPVTTFALAAGALALLGVGVSVLVVRRLAKK